MSRRRQRQFVLLMGLVLVSAFAEVVTLSAVVPFIGVLAAPERVLGNPLVATVARYIGVTDAEELVLPLTLAFVAAALIGGAIRLLLMWASARFVFTSGAELSREVYRRTLYQPYWTHVARSSNEVISGITSKVGGTLLGVMMPLLSLVGAATALVAVMTALVVIDPFVALTATAGFSAIYGLCTWVSGRKLRTNSERIATAYTDVVKALQEGLGGIRDVLLDGTQPVFCEIYRQADHALKRAQGENVFIANSPRYAIESLGMVLIAALAYWLSRQSGGIAAALPLLAALAIGAQRLLPALQQVYSSWATMVGSHALLADTIALLDQSLPDELLQPVPAPLTFGDSVCFDGVRFRYGSSGPWVLDDFRLVITKGMRLGVVGATGSGKSTMLDLLMGLLMPTEGQILVDGLPVSGKRLRAWQRAIAHVPQSIYLTDATVAENIAFGVPRHAIDLQRVREAARRARLADFVESRPEGYDGFVGERGIRLSGGQRQRIGIARALYKQASVLVLDEATSALDNATERLVMDAIETLDRDLTIVLIAHRLSTVRRCDAIVQLENGRVVAQGRYDELLESSQSFRRMAHATTN
jgi:ATP-binding cassette, subfamily B, bacterial PglK